MGRRFTERAVSLPADSSTPIAQRLRGAEGSALMAFASMSCVQLALALSVHVFDLLGPLGVAACGSSGPPFCCWFSSVRGPGTSLAGTCGPAARWAW
jgi:hypothetical protein